MSTVQKTDNYNLTMYNNVEYPLFLGDYSNNMRVIDGLLKSVNDSIADIQRVIDTVSTQNIDNLTARLSALEIKADNNARAIASITSSIAGLDSKINKNIDDITSINRTLATVQSDIEELKRRCDNTDTTLSNHGLRISTNENAIVGINEEIPRIKEDVLGNARDIETLATQIASIGESKQDTLIAGTGISIVNNVISTTE